ncbi:ATP-dependent dethiobiotin synthetase BioD protein [Marine Group I thaumarchaeote SCGC AAA799-B03]|uniref:ATP-dependent dethiobiotin synthetase BioD n=3 Tax=Marine Group I TaxID=905826 RepID=A0A087S8F3_9ARCH|nr:ATP-dependent dethiobiotin synthetase BioD protein [Marine Group I thaumarchaeote SCGC AAA799-N04]KFM18033.1 ATP-dependent dethiobiotin synthetase BioD protein [Marine Group I thaumarchaeote SCGC RSA3]KFM22007.1 ATP-dependent dethiobiotin synthetase BioD protein [Marine Group I thaumarchaeote SCGC AAA799-B03]
MDIFNNIGLTDELINGLFQKYLLKSVFITGTDTDVGKTYITAGLAVALRKMDVDVGVMKPFAAGTAQKKGYKSEDIEILAKAAQTSDPESLVNPQFFPIPASPYTAWKNLKTKPKISTVLSSFKKLSKLHKMILVEGMGGIMTPILKNYYITNLIKEMKIPTVIVTRSKVGTVNHTIMTIQMCQKYKIPIKGIIINNFDDDGYPVKNLKRDLQNLTGVKVLGSIPFIKDMSDASLNRIFQKNLDLKTLLK